MENDTNTGATLNTNKGYSGLLIVLLLVGAAGYAGNFLGQKQGLANGEFSACTKITTGATRLAQSFVGEALPGTLGCANENGTVYFKFTYQGRTGKAPLDLSSFTVEGETPATK